MPWRTSPDLIFCEIMMKVGFDSIEALHRCRQVCRIWNEIILRQIWENKSRRRIMKLWIEKKWGPWKFPSDEEISPAQWLGDGCLFVLEI